MYEISKEEGERTPNQGSYKRHLQLVKRELYGWNNLDNLHQKIAMLST